MKTKPKGAKGSTVRSAIAEDSPTIYAHFEKLKSPWFSALPESEEQWRQIIEAGIEQPNRVLVLVAEIDGSLVGFLLCTPFPGPGRSFGLRCVSILPAYQRRGVGGELVTRLAEWARASRLREITAEVDVKNPDGMGLMEHTGARLGFKPERTRKSGTSLRSFRLKLPRGKEGTK